MTTGYVPWSLFNAHDWSKFNAPRQKSAGRSLNEDLPDKKPAKNRFRGPAGAFNCLLRRRQRRIAGGVGVKFNSLLGVVVPIPLLFGCFGVDHPAHKIRHCRGGVGWRAPQAVDRAETILQFAGLAGFHFGFQPIDGNFNPNDATR